MSPKRVVDGVEVVIEGDPAVEAGLWEHEDFGEYTNALANNIRGFDLQVEVVPGRTKEGHKLLMIGDNERSRLVALSSTRGVMHLVPDDGLMPTLNRGYRLCNGMTFTHLVGGGRASIVQKLELDNYPNSRLKKRRSEPSTIAERQIPN